MIVTLRYLRVSERGEIKPLEEILQIKYMNHPIKDAFLKWQCRVRQIMMRQEEGKPNSAIMPEVVINKEEEIGAIITQIVKSPQYSVTHELVHLAKKTFDPAQRREQAIKFLSATYYQKFKEFSEIITATFQEDSKGAELILSSKESLLIFEAYNQRFSIDVKPLKLEDSHFAFQATIAHNQLFNPMFNPKSQVFGFLPNWENSETSGS